MSKQVGYAEALSAHAAAPHKMAGPTLHSIEVIHHMNGAEPHSVMVEPGKMSEHIAGCEHCASGGPGE
jgi:hypothetical protein